ncbi:unnamed protein product, partial [Prorocentrum cordatum]
RASSERSGPEVVTMGRLARAPGLVGAPPPTLPFNRWQRAVREEWFETQAAFLANVVYAKVDFPETLTDTVEARAMGIFAHYGLVDVVKKCPVCDAPAALEESWRSDNGKVRFKWACSSHGHKHYHAAVVGVGMLKKVEVGSWMTFLNFIALLRAGTPLRKMCAGLRAAWGNCSDKNFRRWKDTYQGELKRASEKLDLMKIGGPSHVVVMDETVVGVHPDDGFESFTHKGIRKGVKKAVMKRPAARRGLRGTGADPRSNGRWLWAAVSVGKGAEKWTHGNGKKRFAWRFLPPRYNAERSKSRGFEEIRKTIEQHVAKKSILVFDGCPSSLAAAEDLGFRRAPPVVHEVGWRDVETGWHSNDIESENNRLTHWSRVRYSVLEISELDMYEYACYVNAGDKMADVMLGLAWLALALAECAGI